MLRVLVGARCEEWLEREDSIVHSRDFHEEPALIAGREEVCFSIFISTIHVFHRFTYHSLIACFHCCFFLYDSSVQSYCNDKSDNLKSWSVRCKFSFRKKKVDASFGLHQRGMGSWCSSVNGISSHRNEISKAPGLVSQL
ncbi:hypothetical protein L2E82_02109 [Cichorium intybus]|uniref:Uncharacterized protein n=1 Tax=Cichorium intybus TaxID=13427 RepID=A0ACB9H1X3_CICIN|nr:hypothetical protein L2E82_02109 [Cichorium intybus]